MIKKYLVLFFVIISASYSFPQYTIGNHYAGPSLGLSFLGSVVEFGGNYEYAMNLQDIGTVGVGGILRYWTYSTSFIGGKWSYTDFLIGAQGNYHFKIPDNNQWDPWAGLVLGYDVGSVDYVGPAATIYSEPSYGGFFIGIQGGARYWINPQIALTGRISFGNLSYGGLDVGVDFKF